MKKLYSAVLVGLVLSLLIYVFYRTDKTLVNALMLQIFPAQNYHTVKASISSTVGLPPWVVYSLPGGLWLFAATLLARRYYIPLRRGRLRLVVIPMAFALGLEFCQLLNLTTGYFDWWDVGVYLLAYGLALLWVSPPPTAHHLFRPFTLESFTCLLTIMLVLLAHVNS